MSASIDHWKEQASVEIGTLERDTETLRAMVNTLLGRVEALERTVAAMRVREQNVRRAVGQLAKAHEL